MRGRGEPFHSSLPAACYRLRSSTGALSLGSILAKQIQHECEAHSTTRVMGRVGYSFPSLALLWQSTQSTINDCIAHHEQIMITTKTTTNRAGRRSHHWHPSSSLDYHLPMAFPFALQSYPPEYHPVQRSESSTASLNTDADARSNP